MTLDCHVDDLLLYQISFGDATETTAKLLEYNEDSLPVGWDDAVQDNVWTRTHSFTSLTPGSHVLAYRPLSRGYYWSEPLLI